MDLHKMLTGWKKKISLALSLGVVTCLCSAQAEDMLPKPNYKNAPARIQHYGYYYSGAYINDMLNAAESPTNPKAQRRGKKQAQKVLNQVNTVWVSGSNHLDQFKRAAAAGKKIVYDVHPIFMDGNYALRPDFLSRWENFKKEIEPYKDSIAAFYPLDEPNGKFKFAGLNWSGMSQQLSTINKTIKASFPDKPTAVIFGTGAERDADFNKADFKIPEGYDWVAFDSYGKWDDIPQMIGNLKSKMNRNQKLFLIPDAYSPGKLPSPNEQKQWIDRARRYYHACASDYQCIGLFPFIYQNLEAVPASTFIAPDGTTQKRSARPPSYNLESMKWVAAEFQAMGKGIVRSQSRRLKASAEKQPSYVTDTQSKPECLSGTGQCGSASSASEVTPNADLAR